MDVLISAGEASGENYGAMLIAALRQRLGGDMQFFGVGGARMKEAGCEIVVDSASIAAVGITEVAKHVAQIYREFFRVVGIARQRRPSVAVLIDFPDFNLRLAQKLHEMQVPVVYFVSPQLWAWKQRRIWRVRKFVDRMLVIFPFEEDYYRQRGVQAQFVGHPLADLELPQISREDFARKYNLDTSRFWIALLPGSRRKEVLLNLPAMLETARQMGSSYQYMLPVASTLASSWMAEQIAGSRVHLVDSAREALFHARAGVVASGTATVEAALIETPFLVVYRVSRLTYAIGRRLVKVPHYGMVNLIAGRRIVPELIQEDFTPANVLAELDKLLPDGAPREEMITNLRRVRQMLRPEQSQGTAISRAAEAIIKCLPA
ncbi:MAG TPA: lipid-A-disaccharide synthase [Terriglobales bacterium]|nr:lipid-A-disaccharide synthase [Terriglobales bacterium]